MVRLCHFLLFCLALLAAAPTRADLLGDWNATAAALQQAGNVAGAPAARQTAMLHVAMADAVNTVQNRYQRYAYRGALRPQASAEVAAAAAARAVLLGLYPAQQARIDAAYAASAGAVSDGAAKDSGAQLGAEAAAAVLAERANDNSSVPDSYRPRTTPGIWVPTTPPLTAQYANAKPWGFERADQFRPGPPPALNTAAYARDYNETRSFGGLRSTQRSAEQTAAVKFWSQSNIGLAWRQAEQQLGAARKLDLADATRLSALLSMGFANSFIVDWDAKFHYHYWRPITAIRNGDQDDNPATEREADWTPLNATPMHPEYPSQAAILAGVGQAMLLGVLGEEAGRSAVTVTDSADPKLQRRVDSLAAMAEEQRAVRIWGGIHFRSSLEASDRLGKALVQQLLANCYRPI